jgi:hypothetical protein
MKRATSLSAGARQQRGFWLRCFLGLSGQLSLLSLVLCGSLHAQPELPQPIRITSVVGYVVNTDGKPVANAEITLVKEAEVASSTRTDEKGTFRIDHVSGSYLLRVARTENAPAEQQIVVTPEIVTRLERKKLYIVLGPGACADACSTVYTDKREFEKAIRKFTRH